MKRSSYNERFSFDNPLSKEAASRSARYRSKKRSHLCESFDLAVNSSTTCSTSAFTPQVTPTPPPEDDEQGEDNVSDTLDNITENDHTVALTNVDEIESYPLSLEAEMMASSADIVDSDDEDNDNLESSIVPPSSTPEYIFDGSTLTVSSSAIIIQQYKLRHNITDEALGDLLKLVKMHCPSPNQCISTIYHFKKQFNDHRYPITLHYYCSKCYTLLASGTKPTSWVCSNTLCRSDEAKSVTSFIEISLNLQLKTILERDGVMYTIFLNRQTQKNCPEEYEDIKSGKIYQDLIRNGFLRDQRNISFTFNTDGIPVFRSSGFSFWPLYLLINELPYRMRCSKENRILAGLWYGTNKPEMTLFLKPLMKSLSELYNDGIAISPPPTFSTFICRGTLICTTCDLPAKAMVMNFTQFNGFYGCCHCLQPGETFQIKERSFTHIYPYKEEDPCGPLRTHSETCQHMSESNLSGSPVFGVKGASWLSVVPCYDVINGLSVDYMHCVLLGVCRQLLRLWLQSNNHNEVWYIGNQVTALDERICSIKPPNEIQRTPRSLDLTLKFWKAHELRAWLLHYSTGVLYGILPEMFYQHHLLLVDALFMLLQETISEQQVDHSFKLLQHYCFMFGSLYGEKNMTINVHSLLHLSSVVSNLGPLWAHSCFSFESANGELLKLFHGSQSVEKQVVNHVSTIHKLPSLAETSLHGDHHDVYKEMTLSRKNSRKYSNKTNSVLVCGKLVREHLTSLEKAVFDKAEYTCTSSLEIFNYPNIQLPNGSIIIAKSRSRSTKRDNSCLRYIHNEIVNWALLDKVFTFTSNESITYCVLIKLTPTSMQPCLDEVTNARLQDHLTAFCIPSDQEKIIITSDNVVEKCVFMDMSSQLGFVLASRFPNNIEID